MKIKKLLFPFLIILASTPFFAVSQINEIHCGAFDLSDHAKYDPPKEDSSYIKLVDGTKIYGNKIKWVTGILSSNTVQIDGKKYGIKEVNEIQNEDGYFERYNKEFIRRVIAGKLSLFMSRDNEISTNSNGTTSRQSHCFHYIKKGGKGPLTPLANLDGFQAMVADCPIALEMVSITNKELRRAIKENSKYLTEVLEIYNSNDCKRKKGK